MLKLVDAVVGLRVAKEAEQEGLDAVLHGEEAYALADGPGARAIPAAEEQPAEIAEPLPASAASNA